MDRTLLLLLCPVAILITCAGPAEAVTRTWTGNGFALGSWSDPANWDPHGVPAHGDIVILPGTGPFDTFVTYNYAGPSIELQRLTISRSNTINTFSTSGLVIGSGSLRAGNQFLGDTTGGGSRGWGRIDQSGGSNQADIVLLGRRPTDVGTYNLSGTGNLTISNQLIVGHEGRGFFNHSGGTSWYKTAVIGGPIGGIGTYNLSGGLLRTQDFLAVGYQGTGTLTISNGAMLDASPTASVVLGWEAGSGGTASLTGTGSIMFANTLFVGYRGGGTLSIENGAMALVSTGTFIGHEEGGTGSLTVTGANSTLTAFAGLFVGGHLQPGPSGTLNVADGGTVNTGTLRAWNQGIVNYQGGAITAGMIDLRGGGRVLVSAGGNKILTTTNLAIQTDGGSFIDLADNEMVVNDTPLQAVHALVASGYAGGAWNGPGIRSSAAASQSGRALGIAPTASPLVKFTWAGDANLDGQVSIADLGILAANWQQSNRFWHQGDFNFDGQITIADLGILAANWQAGVSAFSTMTFNEALAMFDIFSGVSVPEPASLGLLALGSLLLSRDVTRRGGRKWKCLTV